MTAPSPFAPPEPGGPPDYPLTQATGGPPPAPRRPRRRRAVLVGVLVLLAVAGVLVALFAARPAPPPPPAATGLPTATNRAAPDAEPGQGARRAPGGATMLVGTIVSARAGEVVLTPDGGGGVPRTVRTDDRTAVRGAGARAVADLEPGERVSVRVSGTGTGLTATSIRTVAPRVTGTVTALAGDTATVLQPNGLGVPVNVAGLPQKPTVGQLVTLTGRIEGNTLTADRMRVLPTPA